jgi:motility quorum-sensing regulator/GCU-specific mRNA interferase toxin
MEKKVAHYSLDLVQTLILQGRVRVTVNAQIGAATLGLTIDDILTVVANLITEDFYKSMTTLHDKKVWQDVYHYQAETVDIYLKLQIISDVVIISFKEL